MLSFVNDVNEEKTFHLVLEFFSAGKFVSPTLRKGARADLSVILVSSTYTILAVLRTFRPVVPPGGDPEKYQMYDVGAHYSPLQQHFTNPQKYETMTAEKLRGILMRKNNAEEVVEEEEVNALMPQGDQKKNKKSFKKKKEGKNTLRKSLLSGAAEYGKELVEEIIRASGVDGNTLITQYSDDGTPPSPHLVKTGLTDICRQFTCNSGSTQPIRTCR